MGIRSSAQGPASLDLLTGLRAANTRQRSRAVGNESYAALDWVASISLITVWSIDILRLVLANPAVLTGLVMPPPGVRSSLVNSAFAQASRPARWAPFSGIRCFKNFLHLRKRTIWTSARRRLRKLLSTRRRRIS